MTVIDWNADVVVKPSKRQKAFGMVRAEIQESPWFLDVGFRVGFKGTDYFRELHGITNEEDREVVAD